MLDICLLQLPTVTPDIKKQKTMYMVKKINRLRSRCIDFALHTFLDLEHDLVCLLFGAMCEVKGTSRLTREQKIEIPVYSKRLMVVIFELVVSFISWCYNCLFSRGAL